MLLRLIGQVLDKKQLVGFVYLDMSETPNKGGITAYEELKQAMANGCRVSNASIVGCSIVGTEGSLDRLAEFSVDGKLISTDRISVLGVYVDSKGNELDKYLLLSSLGGKFSATKNEVIKYIQLKGGTNATVRDTVNGFVLSPLKGEFSKLHENETRIVDDKQVKTGVKKRTITDIMGKSRPYTVRKNLVRLDYRFRGFFAFPERHLYTEMFNREVTLLNCIDSNKPAPSLDKNVFMGNTNNGYNSILNIYSYLRPDLKLNNLSLSYIVASTRLVELRKNFNTLNAEYKELKSLDKAILQARKNDGEYLSNYEFNYLIGNSSLSKYETKLLALKAYIDELNSFIAVVGLEKYASYTPVGIKKYAQSGKMSFVLFNMQNDNFVKSLFPKMSDITSNLDALFFYYGVKELAYTTVSYGVTTFRVTKGVDKVLDTRSNSYNTNSLRGVNSFCQSYKQSPDFNTFSSWVLTKYKLDCAKLIDNFSDFERTVFNTILGL